MKHRQRAAATAILGLAFGGLSASAEADPGADTSEAAFNAVNNLASSDSAALALGRADSSQARTASASGTPIGEASVTTGNRNTVEVADTVLTACAGGQNTGTQFQEDCNAVVGSAVTDPSGASDALTALTADQVLAQNNAAAQQVEVETDVVASRMLGLRLASQATDSQLGEALAAGLLYGRVGGAASADALGGETGLFFSVKYLDGSQDRDSYTRGFDMDGWNLTAGADHRFGPNLIAGVMATYTQGTVDYDGDKGRMTMDGWGLGAYGTYYLDNGAFIEGIAGYNWNDYDLKRNVQYTLENNGAVTRVDQTAKSSPGGGVFYATLGGGYAVNRQSFTITPQLSLNYVQNSVDSYRERMSDPSTWGGSWALAYDSQTYTSFTSRLGVMIANAISTGSGVFVPQLSLDWVHEFANDQEDIGARFVNDISATPLVIWTSKPDHNYFDLGVGVSGQFANGRSAFVSFNTILGYENVSQYAVTGGVRLEF